MEKIKKIENVKAANILKYIIIFFVLFIANKAEINGSFYPFIFGLYFAFIWCNQSVVGIGACYIVAGYLANFSHIALIENFALCLLFSIIYFIHYKLKKPFKLLHILIYSCICNIPKMII